MSWDAPFLLFSLHGDVNDGNFLLTTLGGLGLFVTGILVGHTANESVETRQDF